MSDPYNLDRVEETARRMLNRYGSAKIASEMAFFHSTDFPRDSREALYWREVVKRIDRIATFGRIA